MGNRFQEIAFTDAVLSVQIAQDSRKIYEGHDVGPAANHFFGPAEKAFIEGRDSFFVASIGENGWPYVQHRGGLPGFVQVIDQQTMIFPDYRGNRQFISLGNLAGNARVCLFMMDYAHKRRLKIYAEVNLLPVDAPELASHGVAPNARTERYWKLALDGFDWNCSQYITPRYGEAVVREVVATMQARIVELEAELASYRKAGAP